jgi:hypothetical protein
MEHRINTTRWNDFDNQVPLAHCAGINVGCHGVEHKKSQALEWKPVAKTGL